MIGRLIERLFVSVQADLSQLGGQLRQGVTQTNQATTKMAMSWGKVESQVQRLSSAMRTGKITQGQYTSQMNSLASQMKGVAGSYQMAQKQVWAFAAAQKAAATVPPIPVRPMQQFARSAGQSRMQMMNLGYQINDIGMTLATGMNPMTVLIQQGSQILQIYSGQGGVRAAFGDLSRILGGIARKAWPLAVIAGGLKMLQDEINNTSDVTVTFGDTALAVVQVLGRKIMEVLAPAWQAISPVVNAVMKQIADIVVTAGNFIIKSFQKAVAMIKAVWGGLPGALGAVAVAAANGVIGIIEGMVNGIIHRINGLFKGIEMLVNKLPDWAKPQGGFNIGQMSDVSLPKINNPFANTEGGKALAADLAAIDASNPMGALFEEVKTQAISNAAARIAKEAEKAGKKTKGGMGKAKKATDELKKAMQELNDEVKTAADNMAGVFGRAFERIAETGKFSFRELMLDLSKTVIGSTSQLLQQELSKVFQSMMMKGLQGGGQGNFFANIAGNLFGSGSNMFRTSASAGMGSTMGGGGGGFGSFFSSLFGGLFGARARGGVEMPWRSFVAGEEGAELVGQDGPAGARRVATAGRTRHMMQQQRGGPTYVTMNISTPDVNSFRASQSQLASRMGMAIDRGRRNQ